MDWLICIGFGIMFGAIIAFANTFSRWTDEAVKGGAYKRKKW